MSDNESMELAASLGYLKHWEWSELGDRERKDLRKSALEAEYRLAVILKQPSGDWIASLTNGLESAINAVEARIKGKWEPTLEKEPELLEYDEFTNDISSPLDQIGFALLMMRDLSPASVAKVTRRLEKFRDDIGPLLLKIDERIFLNEGYHILRAVTDGPFSPSFWWRHVSA